MLLVLGDLAGVAGVAAEKYADAGHGGFLEIARATHAAPDQAGSFMLVIATARKARREAIQNAGYVNGLWIATALRASR